MRAAGALFPGADATVLTIHEPATSPVTTFRAGGTLMSPELVQRSLTELEVPVTPRELARDAQLFASQAVDQESTLSQVIQEGKLDVDAQAGQDQVVSLRHGYLRGYQRSSLFLQDLDYCRVRRVRTVRLGV